MEYHTRVKNEAEANLLALALVRASCRFTVTPWPDGEYHFSVHQGDATALIRARGQVNSAPETGVFLYASTGMVTEHDMNALLTERARDDDNPIFCAPHEYGAWVFAYGEEDADNDARAFGYSEAFIELQRYVRRLNTERTPDQQINWINLDADAAVVPDLPMQDW